MSSDNRVSIQIPLADLTKVLEAIKVAEQLLKPYLISLSPDERKELPKMSDKTTPFVEKALEYAESNPEFAPPYMNVPELKIDLNAVYDLTKIFRAIAQLYDNISDTTMLSGSEAYVAALTYYNSIKQAAKLNVPGAKPIQEDLKKRFEKSKGKEGEEDKKA
jgi:hypothetical protein